MSDIHYWHINKTRSDQTRLDCTGTGMQHSSTAVFTRQFALADKYSSEETTDTFYEACINGDSEKVTLLLEQNSTASYLKKHGWRKWTPLHAACSTGNLEIVQHIIGVYSFKSFLLVDFNRYTPLHIACMNGHMHIVDYILMNIEYRDCDFESLYGDTPLHCASECGHLDCMKVLVIKGKADINKTNHFGQTALYLATFRGFSKIIEFLLKFHFCNPNVKTKKNGNSAIHAACSKGHLDCLKFLLALGKVNVNVQNFNGLSPLHYACEKGYSEIVMYLLKAKCNPTLKNSNKETAMHLACTKGHTYCLRMVYETGQLDINSLNIRKQTPLHLACLFGRLDTIKFLLAIPKCNPNLQDIDGNTPLHLTICNKHYVDTYINCFQSLFFNQKVVSGATNNMLQTSLHLICTKGIQAFLTSSTLKNMNASANLQDLAGNTPLHYAALFGHLECIQMFNCIDILNIRNNDRYTMLDVACLKGHTSVVNYLLKCYQCISHNSFSASSVALCSQIGNLECLKLLRANGCLENVDQIDTDGHALIHYACQNGQVQVVQFLLFDLKGNPYIRNKNGFTPIHLTCINGQMECLQLLLNRMTCDGSLSDQIMSECLLENEEKNPLICACTNRHTDCVFFILDQFSIDKIQIIDILLKYACRYGLIIILERLLIKSSNAFDDTIRDKDGNTLVHITCLYGQLNCLKYLNKKQKLPSFEIRNNSQQTPLHLACIHGDQAIVEYLLSMRLCKLDTIDCDGLTPMAYASENVAVLQILIRYGAKPIGPNAFRLVSKFKSPLKYCLSIFIVGDHSAGKTTIVEALQTSKTFKHRLMNISPVINSVPLNTAGIFPHEVESKKFGKVTFYDFAGHREFHSCHSVIFSRIKDSCTIILVVDLQKSIREIENCIHYWCMLVANSVREQCKKIPLIVVGSHADVLESNGQCPETLVQQLLKHSFLQQNLHLFELVAFIPMNCQLPDSTSFKQFKKLLKSCVTSKQLPPLSYNIHCLYVFLVNHFRQTGIVSLQALLQKIELSVNAPSESDHDLALLLPLSLPHLEEMCESLEVHGHILLLNLQTAKYIVLNKESILHEINGTIFAPVECSEHISLASSTGVVPFHKVKNIFVKWDPQVIVEFLSQMELCHQICDASILKMIQSQDIYQMVYTKDSADFLCEPFLFFPSLIQLQAPENIWKNNIDFPLYFGWTIFTNKSTDFLVPRFHISLIVRIAFSYALALEPSHLNQDNPSLQRKCSVWKNGIFWGSRLGIEALVEICENSRAVVFMIRTSRLSAEFLQLRSSLMILIRQTLHEFCPLIATSESFIAPNELKDFPLQSYQSLTQFSTKEVASAIISGMPAVVGKDGTTIPVNNLLLYDVYSQLSIETLAKLFLDECCCVDEFFLINISAALFEMKQEVLILFKDFIHKEGQYNFLQLRTSDDVLVLLHGWNKFEPGNRTVRSLQSILDRWSAFAGISQEIFTANDLLSTLQCPVRRSTGFKDKLDRQFLPGIRRALWEIRHKWHHLALQLGIHPNAVEIIREQNGFQIEQCFIDMLTIWLSNQGQSPPTFDNLADALCSRPVDCPYLVKCLHPLFNS